MKTTETIIFIHGMFQNARSWDRWVDIAGSRGFECINESWPLHEGTPRHLRDNPPSSLGTLSLQEVVDHYERLTKSLPDKPVVIGHSVGGLVAQKLVAEGLIKAAVPICSVAPNRMLACDWGFFKNSLSIANPLLGDSIFEMTPEGFHENFANTMDREASDRAYEEYATHDSRNVLRDCMLDTGNMDITFAESPMLFISAEEDRIIPPELCEKNLKIYERGTVPQLRMFSKRSHFICGEPGWEQVVHYVCDWIEGQFPAVIKRRERYPLPGNSILVM